MCEFYATLYKYSQLQNTVLRLRNFHIYFSRYPGTELIPETKIRSSLTLVAQEVTKSK